jgi:diadenosine tetraphosphate (Ap4A) HIT family hydrolase
MTDSASAFSLHPQLAADTLPVGDLMLSRVLLMNNTRFPWILLVPRRPGIRETIDLADHEQAILWREISAASVLMRDLFRAEKLNVCAIGNLVPQLHVHVVARFATDEAWPKPVFGFAPAKPYAGTAGQELCRRIAAGLGGL